MAAEIQGKRDIIDDEALSRPLTMAKNIKIATAEIDKFLGKVVKMRSDIGAADSISKLKKETVELTQVQKELEAISKQIAKVEAQSTEEYIKKKKALEDVKKQQKDLIALGKEDALTVEKQTASLKKLEAALRINRDAYSRLATEEARNSVEGKKLLAVIQSQDKVSKELSKAMGQNQKDVGSYKDKILEAAQVLGVIGGSTGTLIVQLKALGLEMAKLLLNPFFLLAAAVVGAFAAVKASADAFYSNTVEGQEKLVEQNLIWDAFFANLKRGFGEAGKGAAGFFADFKSEALKAILFTFSKDSYAKFKEAEDNAGELAKAITKLEKDHIRDVVDDARTELIVNDKLEQSKDKLKKTDVERLTAFREAKAALEKQVEGDIQLAKDDLAAQQKKIELLGGYIDRSKSIADLTDDEIRALGENKEEVQKLIQAEIALFKIQSDAAAKKKALNRQEFQMVEDIRKAEQDRIDRTIAGQRHLAIETLNAFIKVNDLIIKDENASLDDRLKALEENVQSRKKLLQIELSIQMDALKHAAEERIRGEGKLVNDKILEQDQAFVKERLAINEKFNSDIQSLAQYNGDTLVQIVKSNFDKEAAAQREINAEKLRLLNDDFLKGELSLVQYENAKNKIQSDAQKTQFDFEEDSLQKIINARKDAGIEANDLEIQLAKLRQVNAELNANKLLAIEKQLQQKKKEIINASLDLVLQLGQTQIAKEQERLDLQLAALKENYDKQLLLAGDNDREKERLQLEFARKEKEIQNQKKRLQRQQAIFEKELAIARAIVNTAVAVTENIGVPILAAAIGALGAIEIAIIAAQPIPTAEFGIKDHKGGPIQVSERGRELAVMPGGRLAFTPISKSIIDLPAGSDIIPNNEVMNYLATRGMGADRLGRREDAITDSEMIGEIRGLRQDVRNNRPVRRDIVKDGATIMEAVQESDTHTRLVRSFSMGKWINHK